MKNISFYSRLLKQLEGKPFISDVFHKRTSNKALQTNDDPQKWPESWKKMYFKTYPRFKSIHLNSFVLDDLIKLIHTRRSERAFTNKPITQKKLSYLLYSSAGLIHLDGNYDNTRRPYPSAGARYPLEIYPIILNVAGLNKGLYHYNVRDNVLELLLKENLSSWISQAFGGQDWLLKSSVIFIITGVLDRSRIKYGDRGYRFTLIEAGHLGQNVCLFATKLGLGTCALGGYVDSEIDKLLDLHLTKEFTLYAIAIGAI